ncbi:MAG: radical SAM protein [Thermoprotei archaeon]
MATEVIPVDTISRHVITETKSVCPECNLVLPATVYERDGRVYMDKVCPEHGRTEELYFGSYDMYVKFSRYLHNGKGTENPNVRKVGCDCPNNCGLCESHLSHTGLANLVVTNRCDLTCWYCFFYAKKGVEGAYVYEPSLQDIKEMAEQLRAERPVPGNAVQITGGEPTIREDLPEIIRIIKATGVDHIQLNTNGINIALKPELAKIYREAGVNTLYMSFDGVTPKTNPKNHWEAPYTIEACRKVGLGIVLVPTVIKSVNDHELGDIIRFAQRNMDVIRAVNFQPVSLTGRMTKSEREKYRITIPDCIQRIEEQTGGMIPKEAWFPVPSCVPITHFVEAITRRPQYELSIHFACGAGTYVFENNGKLIPITSFVDVEGLLEYLQEKTEELEAGANKYVVAAKILSKLPTFIDKDNQPEGINFAKLLFNALVRHNYSALGELHKRTLFLGMMHFQDKYNHDEERLRRCDIHYLTPDNRIIPFCAFNVFPEWYRDAIQAKYGTPIEEWEKKTGRTLEQGLYRGTLRRGKKPVAAGCAVGALTGEKQDHKVIELQVKQ